MDLALNLKDTYVCAKHFDDYAIQKFIHRNSSLSHKCSYCDFNSSVAEAKPVIKYDNLFSFLSERIGHYFDDPNDEVGWESSEGGWQGCDVYDTDDLFEYIGLWIDNNILRNDLIDSFGWGKQWCEEDPYGPKKDEELMYDWEDFCTLLKHEVRYVFYKSKKRTDDREYRGEMYPYEILDLIGDAVIKLNLITSFEKSEFYRARLHNEKDDVQTAEDLGSPPNEKAKTNRFSPAGISMFYGSDTPETSITEVKNGYSDEPYITYGKFICNQKLNLVDFTRVKRVSIFDEKRQELFYATSFLMQFARNIAKPVSSNNEAFEYVPTQVVTEYLRFVLSEKAHQEIHGIKYQSARLNGGICYVLFMKNEDCGNLDDLEKRTLLLDKKTVFTKMN